MGAVKPIKDGHISSGYGWRVLSKKKEFHFGLDIGGEIGCETKTPYDVQIAVAGWSDSYGWRIWGVVLNGEMKGKYMVMAHHKTINDFKIGQIIKAGEVIGVKGNTGLSQTEHLHISFHDSPAMGSKSYEPKELIALYLKH